MKSNNIILDKSFLFAVRIIKLYQQLQNEKREYVLSKQLLRSGTSIGANVHESVQAFSKKEFIYKLGIALKEASESQYWLKLMQETGYISPNEFDSINKDCIETIKIITSIIKTSKMN